MLNLQTGTNRFASQKGMTGFGQTRWNITKTYDKGYLEPDREGECILRGQLGSNKFASQKGHTAMGAIRNTMTKIHWKEDMTPGNDVAGEVIVPMQAGSNKFASQTTENVVMFGKRNAKMTIFGRLPRDRKTEMMIPYQSGTNIYASQAGMADPPGVGAFRQATQWIDGMNFTEEQLRKGTIFTPWQYGSNKFASQKLSGGFQKYRDVLTKMVGGKAIADELLRQGEGLVRLQSGTNKFASQKGMTDFGARRLTVQRPKWKSEWIEEWEEAEEEWINSGRGARVDLEKKAAEEAMKQGILKPAGSEVSLHTTSKATEGDAAEEEEEEAED